jgi:hypothetical protein
VAKSSKTWLFLDSNEGAGDPTIWFWRDLATDQSSQEFSSEEEAFEALRKGELAFSPAENPGE